MALRKTNKTIREFALIRALQRRFAARAPGIVQGIGDDAAIVAASPDQWWHVTTDLLAEGVHFDLRTASLASVGYRAAMANLSDLAAMGALPRFLLVSLALPKTAARRQVFQLYAGLMKACRLYGVVLIGGDTSTSISTLFVNITLMGTTRARRALFRKGARSGDAIYVTGTLGDSLAGLQLLTGRQTMRRQAVSLRPAHRTFLIHRHLRPTARVAEGQWLNDRRLATAAIDLSDGLSGDLRHICEASRVGAELDTSLLPLSPACRAYAELHRLDPAGLALAGGEDYELLFTVSKGHQRALERDATAHGYRVTRIGFIRPRRFGLQMTAHGGLVRPLPMTSYTHFHR